MTITPEQLKWYGEGLYDKLKRGKSLSPYYDYTCVGDLYCMPVEVDLTPYLEKITELWGPQYIMLTPCLWRLISGVEWSAPQNEAEWQELEAFAERISEPSLSRIRFERSFYY